MSSPQPSRVAAHEPVSPATTAVGSSSAQPDAGSHKRPAALLKPTTLFSSTALETTPLAITCEEMDGTAVTDARVADALTAPAVDQNEITQRLARFRIARQQRIGIAQQQRISIRVMSAADVDAEALDDPNCWGKWALICERQEVDSLS